MTITLHPPQQAAINATLLAMRAGRKSGLVALPTGVGKTIMVLSLGQQLGVPMLFLVHREELVGQTLRAAKRAWPEAIATSIEAGTSPLWDSPRLDSGGRSPDLVVAMVQTMANRIGSIASDRFGILVVDECHHSPAAQWSRVIRHFTPGFLLGVTATPQRHDGRGLADFYGPEPLYSLSLYRAIEDKYLCPLRVQSIQTKTSLDKVNSGGGDFVVPQLAQAVNTVERNKLVVEAYKTHGQDRLAACFAVDVHHARVLTETFNASGIKAGCVTGGSSKADKQERANVLKLLAAGEIRVVCNVEVLTEGFDLPALSCILWARPTESRSLLIQGIGRALRLAPEKKDCLVIDFVDVTKQHKLASPLDLLGKQKKTANSAENDREPKTRSLLPGAIAQGEAIVSWSVMSSCPWPELPSLDGYCQTSDWELGPASEAQLRYLARFGISVKGKLTKGETSYLINRCQEYEAAFPTPATPKQRAYLIRFGLWEKGMSKRLANQLITNHKESERLQGLMDNCSYN